MSLTKFQEIPYWDEGNKTKYEWYKKGYFKRRGRKKYIRETAERYEKDIKHEEKDFIKYWNTDPLSW